MLQQLMECGVGAETSAVNADRTKPALLQYSRPVTVPPFFFNSYTPAIFHWSM
jgi:hypothetical protein